MPSELSLLLRITSISLPSSRTILLISNTISSLALLRPYFSLTSSPRYSIRYSNISFLYSILIITVITRSLSVSDPIGPFNEVYNGVTDYLRIPYNTNKD